MKNKLKIFILVIILFLTGCTGNAEYNLLIGKEKIIENIKITVPNENFHNDSLEGYPMELEFEENYYANKNQKLLYNKRIEDTVTDKIMYLDYTYDIDEFKNSNFLNSCFKKLTYENNDNYILIDVTDLSYCMSGNEITINIKTDLKVVKNNADIINENIYTWNINKNNFINKNIMIKISKKEFPLLLLILSLSFVVTIFIMIVLFIKKSKKNNEI